MNLHEIEINQTENKDNVDCEMYCKQNKHFEMVNLKM